MTTWLGQFLMCYVVAPITVAALFYLAPPLGLHVEVRR